MASTAVSSVQRVKRSCPNCGSEDRVRLARYSDEHWDNMRCSVCDLIYLREAPVYEALSEDLAWTKQFKIEQKRRKTKQPVVAWLDEKTRWRLHIARDDEWAYIAEKISSGRVLDVGCGKGNRIPEPFTPFGIEIEKEAAAESNAAMAERGGSVIHAPALEGLAQFEDGFFDGVIMRSYLEHEAHPRKVLEATYRALRPGGVIYVKVPNFATINRVVRGREWCGFRFPDHLNYFTINSLRTMADGVGFDFELKNTMSRYTNDNLHCFLTRPT
ncbi:MAG: class I SAM-dependent methyltransferase [Pseudomonadota bacterium]